MVSGFVGQQEPFAPFAGEPQFAAIPRQQSACPVARATGKQANAGIAAQQTTTASIRNAPRLPQFIR
jgi:hypothetical protein